MEEIIKRIRKFFPLKEVKNQRKNLYFLTVTKRNLVSLLTHLRNLEKFTHLILLTAVDYPEKDKFQLTYLLHNYELNIDLGIRVLLKRNQPVMDSIHHLWEQAKVYQRELREMYGIYFPGSPELERSFVLEGWQEIPPMRRDFDTLKYSEETYFPRSGRESVDPRKYMKEKLYPYYQKED